MRGMYLHAERLLAKAGRQGAMGRGISHPKQSGGRAQRRSAQAQRGRLLGNPLRRARAAPSARFGFLLRAHQAHRIFRVALRQEQAAVMGSGECAAVAAREETPPENRRGTVIRDACGESQDCQLQGDDRRCKWDGHAPSWGLETPLIRVTPRGVMQGFPTTLCVGVLWTNVQAPKLKVHGAAYQRLSNSPTSGLWAYLRGRTAIASTQAKSEEYAGTRLSFLS
jgi:hypothetical protein